MNSTSKKNITGGIYLIIDPALGIDFVLPKVEQAIEGGVNILQIWDHWKDLQNKKEFIDAICNCAHEKNIPVLINNEWQWLKTTTLDGVHFDDLPPIITEIKNIVGKDFLIGVTCGNDINKITDAINSCVDYLSFCSMFPTVSAQNCEIVNIEIVKKIRDMTTLPIFLAGGITLSNIDELNSTGMDGIALVSGIMKSEDPKIISKAFKEKLNKNETGFNK